MVNSHMLLGRPFLDDPALAGCLVASLIFFIHIFREKKLWNN